jgi:transposase InsO family protein
MIDKFTKWIEAKPIAIASSEAVVEFIKEVINWYGVMNMIITNNDTQFMGSAFVNFYDEQQINIRWATVAHPKTNGQVERVNGCILQGLKP